jgi:hypothetical protein
MILSPQLYCAHQIFVKGALRWSPRRHWPLEQEERAMQIYATLLTFLQGVYRKYYGVFTFPPEGD